MVINVINDNFCNKLDNIPHKIRDGISDIPNTFFASIVNYYFDYLYMNKHAQRIPHKQWQCIEFIL